VSKTTPPTPPARSPKQARAARATGRRRLDSPATYVVLFLVTCLIWLFAESQTLTRADVETAVTLESPEGLARVARWVEGGRSVSVTLSLEGPRSEIDAATALLRRQGVTLPVGADGGPGSAPRVYELDLAESVRRAAADELGSVSISRAEPEARRVEVDEVITVQAPASFDASGLDLAEPASIEPAEVEVRGPAGVLRALADDLAAEARLEPSARASIRPGVEQRLEARVALPALSPDDRARVTVTPQRVSVRLLVRSKVSTIEVASAPVQVLGLATDLARWRVTPDRRFVDGLAVTGPSDLIERLESRELSIVAVLRLTTEDLQRGVAEKAPSFALLTADGLTPAPAALEITGPGEPVGLEIVDTEAAAPAGDG